jgi:hypothetical protein
VITGGSAGIKARLGRASGYLPQQADPSADVPQDGAFFTATSGHRRHPSAAPLGAHPAGLAPAPQPPPLGSVRGGDASWG